MSFIHSEDALMLANLASIGKFARSNPNCKLLSDFLEENEDKNENQLVYEIICSSNNFYDLTPEEQCLYILFMDLYFQ